MASSFVTMSAVGSLISVGSHSLDKKSFISSHKLSSLDCISSSFSRGNLNCVVPKKRYSLKINAATKQLHFNKNGAAIRKLQVSIRIAVQIDIKMAILCLI